MHENSHGLSSVSRAKVRARIVLAIALVAVGLVGLYVFALSFRQSMVLQMSKIEHRADAAELGGRTDDEIVAFAMRALRQKGIDEPSLAVVPSRASAAGALVFRNAVQKDRFTVEFMNDTNENAQLDVEVVGSRVECVMTGSLVVKHLAKKAMDEAG